MESRLRDLTQKYAVILVTGPRQAGKTSLLLHLCGELFGQQPGQVVTFDTDTEVGAFRHDPELFFLNHPNVRFLDEVQNAPEVFPYLKRMIGQKQRSFRLFLSGSQHFHLMEKVTESLAGRVAVLDLWPLARQEIIAADPTPTVDLLEDPSRLEALVGQEYPCNDTGDVIPAMLAGGYPPMVLEDMGPDWLESYRRTYLERDVRALSQVADLGRFGRFLALCAGRTGTVLNKSEMAGVLGVDHKTVDHWLGLLVASYQMVELPAYAANATKRLVKRSKWVFADPGLGLHLQAIRTRESLLQAPHFGHLFESFVLMEIRKLFGHATTPWNGWFWRTPAGLECDLVLPSGGRLVPIEIKHGARLGPDDWRGLEAFMAQHARLAPRGILISMRPRVERLTPRVFNLPLGLLLKGVR